MVDGAPRDAFKHLLIRAADVAVLAEAIVVIEDWRQDYNAHRPHSALGNQTPDAFAHAWRARTTEPASAIGIFS